MNNGFSETLSSKQYVEYVLQQRQEDDRIRKILSELGEEIPRPLAFYVADLSDRVKELETQMMLVAGLIRSIQSRIDT